MSFTATAGAGTPPAEQDWMKQRLMELLYRRLHADDEEGIWRRRKELVDFFRGLGPAAAAEMLERLARRRNGEPAGDLQRHFERRLAAPTRKQLRRILRKRAATATEHDDSDPRAVQDRMLDDDGTEGRGSESIEARGLWPGVEPDPSREPTDEATDFQSLTTALQRTYQSPKRRWKTELADFYLFVKGKPAIEVQRGEGGPKAEVDAANATATVEASIAEVFDGFIEQKLKVEVDRRKKLPSLKLETGNNLLKIEFGVDPVTPVTIASEPVPVRVAREIPSLGVKIVGSIKIEINVEVAPNYLALSRRPGVKNAVQHFGKRALRVTGRVAGRAVRTHFGRAASATITRFGGRFVGFIPTAIRSGASAGSRLATLAAHGARAGLRVLSGAALIVDAATAPFRVLHAVRNARIAGEKQGFFTTFQEGYAGELASLTMKRWRSYYEWRSKAPTPIRAWVSPPPVEEQALKQWLNGQTREKKIEREEMVMLGEVDWLTKYEEGERVFLALSPKMEPWKYGLNYEMAQESGKLAGRAAAHQDVNRFIAANTHAYRDQRATAVKIEGGLTAWDEVVRYHQRVHGSTDRARRESYRERVERWSVVIEPFHDPNRD